MPNFIKSLSVKNLHGRKLNFYHEFKEGVNILYGPNGAGKTTLLHILANAMNGDFIRFLAIEFKEIQLQFDEGVSVLVTQTKKSGKRRIDYEVGGNSSISFPQSVKRSGTFKEEFTPIEYDERRPSFGELFDEDLQPIIASAYFPAFRTMIEAWSSNHNDPRRSPSRRSDSEISKYEISRRARELFGEFTPFLNYPSINDISAQLNQELENAIIKVVRKDNELIYNAIIDIAKTLTNINKKIKRPKGDIIKEILDRIHDLENSTFTTMVFQNLDIYQKLKTLFEEVEQSANKELVNSVLSIYNDLLKKRVNAQFDSFKQIQHYLDSVNSFLDGKRLEILAPNRKKRDNRGRKDRIGIKYKDESETSIKILSSGERQILTLLYASTKFIDSKILLIDEPELSLHVDWQRKLIKTMTNHLVDNQIITCTHSPVIAADYDDRMQPIQYSES